MNTVMLEREINTVMLEREINTVMLERVGGTILSIQIEAALNESDAPSAANPFATIDDVLAYALMMGA